MIKSIRKEILKASKFIAATVFAISIFCGNASGMGAVDPRSHLFAGAGAIVDEGFRWRNNFDFTITAPAIGGAGPLGAIANAAIPPRNWFLFDGTGTVRHNSGANGIHRRLSAIVNTALNIAGGQTVGAGILEHMAAGAITIVVRNPNNGVIEAYTEIIKDRIVQTAGLAGIGAVHDRVAVAVPAANITQIVTDRLTGRGASMYYAINKSPGVVGVVGGAGAVQGRVQNHVINTANYFLETNIGAGAGVGLGYSCCEGQIISRLFDTNPPTIQPLGVPLPAPVPLAPLFPQIINNLVAQANIPAIRPAGGALAFPITGNNIILCVLHIHTHKDPCAKCSKALSGLSRQMNAPAGVQNLAMTALLTGGVFPAAPPPIPAGFIPHAAFAAVATQQLIANLTAGNASFLIEVSSDTNYDLGAGVCSCSEIAGHDAGTNVIIPGGNEISAPVNVTIPAAMAGGDVIVNPALGIPGIAAPWIFNSTFPPYVLYGRIGMTRLVTSHVIPHAPRAIVSDNLFKIADKICIA